MAKDPYQYFRIEARELLDGLTQGFIDLEKGQADKELVGRLLRLAHTLKGAARVVKQAEISELAHTMEDLLALYREGEEILSPGQVSQLLRLVDRCRERLQSLGARPEQGTPAARPEPEEPLTNVRVEIAEMDALLYDLAETGVHLGALRHEISALGPVIRKTQLLGERLAAQRDQAVERDRFSPAAAAAVRALTEDVYQGLERAYRSLQAGFERTERDLEMVRDRAGELRLLPARAIFAALERSARDVADSLHKRVDFEAADGVQRLDAHVLLALRDALIHVVRNAAAHGIEAEAERLAAGKPAAGRVRLQVRRRGQRVSFLVEDDGRGLDVAAIRRAAVRCGLVTAHEAEALGLAEVTRLLFRGGVSTSPEISEVAGRGVGLDVVRANVARLKGAVSLRSDPGRGTAVEITVPVSMQSLTALAIAVGETTALLPFDAVHHAVYVNERELARSASGAMLIIQGQAVPFRHLRSLLRGPRPGPLPPARSAVVVHAGGERVAIGVDRLEGIRSVVVRPLPALCGSIPLVAGAALDGAGNPELVLDPAALIAASQADAAAPAEPVPVRRPAVLVIDDSLTTRMLEQSILEAAGYQVELATSAEEALAMARQGQYALFMVDIEMPDMDGFELLERFRRDPNLQGTPSILVTSRSSAEDRRRGEQAGARAYIVKSEFDEAQLLQTIRQLIGEEAP